MIYSREGNSRVLLRYFSRLGFALIDSRREMMPAVSLLVFPIIFTIVSETTEKNKFIYIWANVYSIATFSNSRAFRTISIFAAKVPSSKCAELGFASQIFINIMRAANRWKSFSAINHMVEMKHARGLRRAARHIFIGLVCAACAPLIILSVAS